MKKYRTMSYIQEQCHLPKYVPYLYMEEYKLIMNINLWIGLTSITSSLQKKHPNYRRNSVNKTKFTNGKTKIDITI